MELHLNTRAWADIARAIDEADGLIIALQHDAEQSSQDPDRRGFCAKAERRARSLRREFGLD